jgi:NADPH-ferrihemoprotein reductase
METLAILATILLVLVSALVIVYVRKNKKKKPSLFEEAKRKAKEAAEKKEESAKEAYPAGPLVVYFGSQTGTAEEFAKTLEKEGKQNGFDAKVLDLEDFEPDQIGEDGFAMFAVATYGEGDPTDNAIDFHRWIKDKERDLDENTLKGLKFTVFGLGNRQYEQYNEMGRFVNKRLEALGAQRVFDYGEGDDDGTLDEDFEQWREKLWPSLRGTFLGREAASSFDDTVLAVEEPTLQYEVVMMEQGSDSGKNVEEITARARARNIDHVLKKGLKVDLGSKPYFKAVRANVVSSVELRQNISTTSTRHIEIGLDGTGVEYLTADNLSVCPENDPDLVESVGDRLHYDLNRWFVLRRVVGDDANDRPLFPTPCTVRHALSKHCDLTSTARKTVLPAIAYFANDPAERDRLLFLSSSEGKEEYNATIATSRRTIPELLWLFPSVQIPFAYLIELLPRLQARDYTISSSSLCQPSQVSITVSLVNEGKPEGRFHRGVCSNYLGELAVGTSLNILVKPSSFRLPTDPQTPIIMVGPGTGIAPMRAFLQERQHQKHELGFNVGKTVLFFGCRRRDEDFIYEQELLSYTQNGTLTNLFTAFSRENSMKKVYVQHLLAEEGDMVFELVDQQNAYFFVCGGTSMGTDVNKALEQIFDSHGVANVKEYMNRLKASGRYVQELWS